MNGLPVAQRTVRDRIVHCLCLALCLVFTGSAHAAGAPAPEPFYTVNGTVHSAIVSGDRLFLGGEFASVNNPESGVTTTRNLVAISLTSRTVLWVGDVNLGSDTPGAVHAMALSAGGTILYIGGDFDRVRGAARQNLAAINAINGNLAGGWANAPRPDATVRALAITPDGQNLYVGGDFQSIGAEGRRHIASVSPANGTLLPWDPDTDGAVRALAVDSTNARLFAGGEFTTIGGEVRNRLAAIGITTARPLSWDPDITGAAVHALLLAQGRLYVGGEFSLLAGAPRSNLGAFEATGSDILPGALDANVTGGAVRALTLDPEGLRLYPGGEFSAVEGEPRDRLAALRLAPAGGLERVLDWDPAPNATVHTLTIASLAGNEGLYAGGAFGTVVGEAVPGIAILPITRPVTVADPPGGGHQVLTMVTLVCEAGPGGVCFRICHTDTLDEPQVDGDCSETETVDIPITQEITALRFFSEDEAGNRESLRTERYAIDNQAPVTVITPLPLPDDEWYSAATLSPLVMFCEDDNIEFGCATHYTLNGTDPTTASTRYNTPVSLASLLPPPSIPANEVDPLQHLSGIFTVRLFSIDDAGNEEAVQDLVYRVDLAPPVVTPSFPSGTYVAPLSLELECDDGAGSGCMDLYYTTDNSTPSTSSTRYDGELNLTEATILRVFAIDRAGNTTTQTLGIYALSEPTRETRAGVGMFDAGILPLLLAIALWRIERKRV